VEEGESALVQASAIEIRDAVLFRFQELLCQDRAGYDDRLDYFEIRFDGAIANLRRTARRKTWKEENRSQPLSYDDETSELSSEVDPNRPAAPAARAIVVRPGNPSLDRDGVEGDGRARTQGPGREEGLSDAVNKAGVAADTPLPRAPIRKHRRLSDHIVIAFHFACDQGDIEVAGRLLGILERMVLRPPPIGRTERRSDIQSLVAALERLWTVRHPAAGEH
jgi:hypothetical protein